MERIPIQSSAVHREGAKAADEVTAKPGAEQLLFRHKDYLSTEDDTQDGRVGEVKVIGNNEQRTLPGNVLLADYAQSGEKRDQYFYQCSRHIIEPGHHSNYTPRLIAGQTV